ncbi:PREDICTED: uncharacterized protein LOC109581552 [Amphimedon queenslandica]|uniref:Uncharacterized protein n=1 Tax=Amphimedon queenslandica TaxID=400682 RepID=A0AAN0J2R2_AMPQE|nr:PREDICTED: uncharacterized protein LOC109581552 [Amphimedon queenslandica]|eukprot:XP_019851324.1 PREDICTED: uncharacterized protein LOC109581552 [Amphimedon queenslandica]
MSDDGCDITCGLKNWWCCKNECENDHEEKPLLVHQDQPKKSKDSSKNSLQKLVRKKKKTVTELEEVKKELRKRACILLKVDPEKETRVDCNYKEIEELKERREQSDPQKADRKTQYSTVLDLTTFQEVYEKITDIMIGKMMEKYINPLLSCSEGEGQSNVNQKEQYKIYGLLLSAVGKDERTRVKPKVILELRFSITILIVGNTAKC